MPPTCHAGRFAALNVGELLDHMGEKVILPFGKMGTVADDLFCCKPSILRNRRKTEVHVRRFLVHVNDGGEDIVLAYLLCEKVNRRLEKLFDFLPFLPFEEVWTCRDERINKTNAVFARFALRRLYPSVRFLFVRRYRLDDVKIVFAFRGINVGITGVFFFGTLVVSLQRARAAFHLLEPHDGILCYGDNLLPVK